MTLRCTCSQGGPSYNIASYNVASVHEPRPPRPRSPARALALHGPLRSPPPRLAGEQRPGVRGAAGGAHRRADARGDQRPALRGLPQVVGPGRGPDEAGAARAVARAAALRGALLLVPVVAAAGGEAGAGRPYPRSCLRPHGHAGATPARGV